MTPQQLFIARLRRQRERCGISLDEIAGETRVKRERLEAFERGDLSGWPSGLYARSWIREYAHAAGLDPVDTVDEFCRLFPQGDRRIAPTLRELGAIVAQPDEYTDEFDRSVHGDRRRPASIPPGPLAAPRWRDHVARVIRGLRPARARTIHSS